MTADRGSLGLHDPLRQASAGANRRSWPGPWISIAMAMAAARLVLQVCHPLHRTPAVAIEHGIGLVDVAYLGSEGFQTSRGEVSRALPANPTLLHFFRSSSLNSLAVHAPAETHCQLAVLRCGLCRGRYITCRNAHCLSSTMHIIAMQTLCT